MYSGRERKTKPKKDKKEKGGLRQRKKGGVELGDDSGWSSAMDPEMQYGASKHARKGREKKHKKSGRNQSEERAFEDVNGGDGGGFEPYFQPPEPWPASRPNGMLNIHKVSEKLFVSWEELLGSREALKSRIDTIAAVHGWEGASKNRGFLGGVEPSALLKSIQTEIAALGPAADALESMDLMLELQKIRRDLEIAEDERERLSEDLQQSLEDCFEARDRLAGQTMELEALRQEAMSVTKVEAAPDRNSRDGASTAANGVVDIANFPNDDPLAAFKVTLSREQVAEGRRVVHALEKLKLPDESTMTQRELACWHENKKTITNALKTLSSQIYSATTRILYEIIQNADDCSFGNDGSDDANGKSSAVRELYLECSDDALVAFHNENGFQPKDLYAMCQVGESSKAPGSGKIGRKGIGFKSVFQICDRPLVLSPPFQFCFDTIKHEVFGYIVPSWVEDPENHVPERHREHLQRIFPAGSASPSATGTLLVCPMAQRVRGLDLMRDLSFDGLSLAFLKNLEKVSFVSSVSRGQGRHAESSPAATGATSSQREVVYTLEQADQGVDETAIASGVLKGVSVVSHRLSQVTIIERRDATVSRRLYRLHTYAIVKYKSDSTKMDSAVRNAQDRPATTTISLAFPVDDKLDPIRSTDGELIFAYLPVTAAGFGFAINADFELVASRQDVSDSNSGNHVLLGRIPPLFVHAVLTDPCLGEDAFPTYLPDVEAIRKDRSGGGRKWHTLASALHRETGAWMMIPTEDVPERVKRKHVVLRPRHLSDTLVPNSLLKQVTSNSEVGEINFAHPDAVAEMALETCIDYCPVSVVLDCIRTVLHPVDEELLLSVFDDGHEDDHESGTEHKRKQKGRKRRGKRTNLWPGDCTGDFADYARRHHQMATPTPEPSISEEQLLAIWQYLATECKFSIERGEAGQSSLRLILDAVVGAGKTAHDGDGPDNSQQFRIFPVRGSSRLRLHSEFGVPLSMGLSPSLLSQGPAVLRLAERVVSRLDTDRLQDVVHLDDMMKVLQIGDATEIELEQQLRNCFRFGLVTTADPQLWWDSFKYAVSKGHVHGLVDFMPGAAIALPLADSQSDVVSSRDVQRFSVGLPCLLGIRRRPARSNKYLLAIPASVSSWSSRVRWELAMVQAFGLTYPRSDIERIPMGAFATDLLFAVTEARESSRRGTLEALIELIDIYKSRIGSLLPLLQSVLQKSYHLEECLLEKRVNFQPFDTSCSPQFIDEVLDFCQISLSDDCFHNLRDLLENSLGMLQLRMAGEVTADESAAESTDDVGLVPDDECSDNDSFASAEEEEAPQTSVTTTTVSEDDDYGDDDRGSCDVAMWTLLERLLGFYHTFEPRNCPWLLYAVLTPALIETHEDSAWDDPQVPTLRPLASTITHFVRELEAGTTFACSNATDKNHLDVAVDLWPLICNAGGIWLGGEFVTLERCVWKSTESPILQVLMECGCQLGKVVAIESKLIECLSRIDDTDRRVDSDERASFFAAMGNCCIKGSAKRNGSTWSPGLSCPALPHPTCLEMLLDSTLPMLLESEFTRRLEAPAHEDLHVAHEWSHSTLSCYAAVVATLENGGFPRSQRWMVPVPSATLGTAQLVVDRGFNRQLARDSAALLVYPDERNGSSATAFALRHFGEHCLHPDLVELFAPVAERQSIGFEMPRSRVQRTFRRSLHLATAEAFGPMPATPAAAAAAAAAARVDGSSNDGSAQLWALISEVYERPTSSLAEPGQAPTAIPSGLSDSDNWELLLWAAITCAKQYYLAQAATGNTQHMLRYQETLHRVRQLIPFLHISAGREEWHFLAERHDSAADSDGVARGVLLLRSLFGFQLWGNLSGLELLGRPPTYTADIPTSILFNCTDRSTDGLLAASYPEELDRQTLILIWEWFLLEVVGAAPPSVLWSTLQEPIVASARLRIRRAQAEFRAFSADGPSSCLLDSICAHTQVEELMDNMDAVDEARAAAAAREAEVRRQQREAAQARQRAEAEALRQQREFERQQQRLEELEQRRARRAALDAMEAAMEQQQQQEQPRHGRRSTNPRTDLPEPSPQRQSRRSRRREPTAEPAPAPAAPVPQTADEMRDMIRAQQADIDRMRSQLQTTVRVPAHELHVDEPQPHGFGLGHMANTFVRMFGGAAGGNGGDGGAPAVRRHVEGQTMRESEVKGKLARFLAGMRAYERQRAASGALIDDGSQQPLPPVLSEFIAWAGDVLAGEQQPPAGAGGSARRHRSGSEGLSTEESARQYVSTSASVEDTFMNGDEDDEETCCICLEMLQDPANFERLGEPLETACGHRFHAVCYAKMMESTQQDPWCPICRSDTFGTSARFL